MKANKEQFDATLEKLLKAPPLPKSEIAPKRARKNQKASQASKPKK
jgi:hypothetical protein